MFSNNEMGIIWFALLAEQAHHEEGSDHWWRYERMVRRIEEKLGMKPRPLLKIVK